MIKIFTIFFLFIFNFSAKADILKFQGLERLNLNDLQSLTTIDIDSENLNENDVDMILKDFYESEQITNIEYSYQNSIYTLSITETPLIENIYLNGNIIIKDDIFIELINSKKNDFLNKNKIIKDLDLIKNLYTKKGYELILVTASTESFASNRVNLIFTINEGSKSKLSSINFKGANTFSSSYLQSIIKSKHDKFYNIFSNSYIDQSIIENDLNLLIDFYKKNGFSDVKISYLITKNFFGSYNLDFYINENTRYKITDLKFSFSEDLKNIKNFLKIQNDFEKSLSKNNYNFDYYFIDDFLIEINSLLTNSNINSEIIYELILDENGYKINFFDKSNDPVIINTIDIYGNTITKTNVLLSKLPIRPGDYYNKSLIEKTKKKLTNYKYINKVNHSVKLNDQKANIEFEIDENKKTGNFLLGGSFTGDIGIGLIVSLNDYNLFGTGNELKSEFSINSEATKFDILYKQFPYNNANISNLYSIKNTETDLSSSFGYKIDQVGLGYSINFDYVNDISMQIGFEYLDSTGHSPTNSSDLSITDNIGSFDDTVIKFSISQNKTNNFLYPNKGYSNSFSLKYSPDIISDNKYVSANYNGDIYFDFDRSSDYLFLSNSIGLVEAIEGRNRTINTFSLGGMNFKGFDYKGIGNRTANNKYLGGNKYFTSTFGYGSNFLFDDSDNIYIRLFYTVGSLWDNDYANQDFKLRSSIGSSFDVLTPIGPVTFSYAIPLQKENSDRSKFFNFSIGSSF